MIGLAYLNWIRYFSFDSKYFFLIEDLRSEAFLSERMKGFRRQHMKFFLYIIKYLHL